MTSSILKGTVAVGLLLTLGACESLNARVSQPIGFGNDTPDRKYPIHVANKKEEMTLVVPSHVFALSEAEKNQVAWLAETYKHVGHGEIWVVAPTGSANSAASIGAAAEIAKVMVDQGVSPWAIKMNSYQADPTDEEAPITVQFKRYHAYTAPCGNWADDLASSPTNATSANFGCASQSNLAAMVEDPHDLMNPRQIDPTDPSRRSTVFEKYRAGEATGTIRSDDESGTVSDVAE